jgi:hypothetical protein
LRYSAADVARAVHLGAQLLAGQAVALAQVEQAGGFGRVAGRGLVLVGPGLFFTPA